MFSIRFFAAVILALIIFAPSLAYSGSLDAPAAPADGTSAMFTIEDIFNRLGSGATGDKRSGTPPTKPTLGPSIGTGHTLDDVMAKTPAIDNANGAVSSDVMAGKTFWGLTNGAWGPGTGSAAAITAASASVPKTGQTASFAAGDDGELRKGITLPNTRFTDNDDGTVIDNLTTLVWMKDANCLDTVGGVSKTLDNGILSWGSALTWSNAMASGSCGLSDGSVAGAWRLPNINELKSLIDFSNSSPPLPTGHPFTSVVNTTYWSSTTFSGSSGNTRRVWFVRMSFGIVDSMRIVTQSGNIVKNLVWPVRGGQ